MKKKLSLNSPLYVTRRMNISTRNAWFIRGGSILLAFLLAAIICTIFKPGSFGQFFAGIFTGTFGDVSYIFDLLCCVSIYLLLSLAVTPAFKMKFWNIGAEGQAMAGCIITAVILTYIPSSLPGPIVIIMALVGGVVAGMIWALIPTFFKIKFNTNETLFTLMMNYVATALAAMTIALCAKGGSQKFPVITDTSRLIISIGDVKYIPIILIAVLLTVFMIFYLKKSKHGFELSVMGDSTNTARYVGMNIKKITLRTMMISGAIAGLVGFLIVCGKDATLSTTLVGGKGFTAVLISWLGHFNPAEIALYSFIVGFLDQGTTYVASTIDISSTYFSGVIIGLFILVVIVAEFFVRYKINVRKKDGTNKSNTDEKDKTKEKKKHRLTITFKKFKKSPKAEAKEGN